MTDDSGSDGDGERDRSGGDRGAATDAVHAGGGPDPTTRAVAPPIAQTAAYAFESADRAADRYDLRREGDVYSRISNPTVRTLEGRIARLEGGTAAVATASGMAALDALATALARPGDNVVAAADAYGGTTAYLDGVAARRGVEVRTVDTLDYAAYEAAIDDRTAFVHVETLANPSLVTPDLDRLADICDGRAPLVVDNTFATPALCRPIDHGADLTWLSTTKWLHGAGTTVGGALVDGGSFDWGAHPERYPLVGATADRYGFSFAQQFGDRALAATARYRVVSATGALQSPFDAWATLQGLQTLSLRMDRHCESTRVVAEFLRDHPDVDWVTYPGFEDHPTHREATTYLSGYGGVVAFGLGSYEASRRLCEAVDLVQFVANVGDARSMVVHPASTTHAGVSEAQRQAAGVTPDLVRLSVGLEDPADLLVDLDGAIAEAV